MAVLVDLANPEEALAELAAEKQRRASGQQLAEEAADLEHDLRRFVRAAWPVVEPATPFVPNWHIDAIIEHLEAAYRREIHRLLINIQPRVMKSLAVGVLAPAWRWTTHPHERILAASYGSELAIRDAVRTRRLLASTWYRARWGHMFSLTGDQNTKSRYENDRTGYRIATGVGGLGTGEGGDVLLCDDPNKQSDAYSEADRTTVNRWWGGTWSTRLNDLGSGVKIVIQQRIHEDDLTGHILAGAETEDLDPDDAAHEWVHLCLPAEYEPSHPFVCPRDIHVPGRDEPLPGDPRTEPGELLWPEKVSRSQLASVKADMGSYMAAGQLQQRPAPAEGGILKLAWWRFFDPANLDEWQLPPLVALTTYWDTALKEKTSSDFTVGTLWGARGADRFLLRKFRGRVGLPDTKTAVRTMAAWAEEHFPGLPLRNYVENAANGPEVVAELRSKVAGLILDSVKGDKVQRAHAVSPQIESGNVFLPGFALPDGTGPDPARTPAWVQELVSECAGFPNGANDDQVDSTTGALANMRGDAVRTPRTADSDERERAASAGLDTKVF